MLVATEEINSLIKNKSWTLVPGRETKEYEGNREQVGIQDEMKNLVLYTIQSWLLKGNSKKKILIKLKRILQLSIAFNLFLV